MSRMELRRWLLGALSASVLLLVAAGSIEVTQETIDIAGYVNGVRSYADGGTFYLEGATVEVAGRVAVTDSEGWYRLTDVPSGVYDITVSKSGYHTYQESFDFTLSSPESAIWTYGSTVSFYPRLFPEEWLILPEGHVAIVFQDSAPEDAINLGLDLLPYMEQVHNIFRTEVYGGWDYYPGLNYILYDPTNPGPGFASQPIIIPDYPTGESLYHDLATPIHELAHHFSNHRVLRLGLPGAPIHAFVEVGEDYAASQIGAIALDDAETYERRSLEVYEQVGSPFDDINFCSENHFDVDSTTLTTIWSPAVLAGMLMTIRDREGLGYISRFLSLPEWTGEEYPECPERLLRLSVYLQLAARGDISDLLESWNFPAILNHRLRLPLVVKNYGEGM